MSNPTMDDAQKRLVLRYAELAFAVTRQSQLSEGQTPVPNQKTEEEMEKIRGQLGMEHESIVLLAAKNLMPDDTQG